MKKTFLLLFIAICFNLNGYSSDTIYFNPNWEITSKTKGAYYRIADMNATGFFYEGAFKDYSIKKNNIISSGCYDDYNKQGSFEEYYENGNVRAKGQFTKNKRSGLWVYNYENGQFKMSVDFSTQYFNIIEFRDTLNNLSIKNGTGQCIIDVSVFGIPAKLIANFSEGVRDGKWIYSDDQGEKILIEKYNKGTFLYGDFKGTIKDNNIIGPFLTNRYFNESKYFITEKMCCERGFDEKYYTFLKHLTKEINFSNSESLTCLNSQMPVDAIICMANDHENNYWFGTDGSGLIKLDTTFTFFNKTNSPCKSNFVSKIAVDKTNKVWFTYGADSNDYSFSTSGLACYSENKIKIFNTENSGLTCNIINDIAIDSNNIKWFATLNCIISYDEPNSKWTKHFNIDKKIRIIDTLQFSNKREYLKNAKKDSTSDYSFEIYAGTQYELELKTINGRCTYYENPSCFTDIKILPNNDLYINSFYSGCSSYDGINWNIISDSIQYECMKFQLDNFSLCEESQRRIFEYSSIETTLNPIYNPMNQIITGLNNLIWIQCSDRIVKVSDSQIIEYRIQDNRIKYAENGKGKSDFYCIFLDAVGSMWAGINGGIIKIE
ncbi:hypothetical protein GQR60_08520 [Labilibaculum sp. A4]|uniref:toxin-antitoxin system YwqK family antitoxin n=1 Tax=Labilibaculum euxinus TaxID=2686357 RepID=UPI000F61A663|nr:hypothetical protein [Labilibaculum euxinus]MDQ1769825.1 hypothetical protein [Labilibaculum euxinus]MWN76382.1 hypothetical protein [Labilibaculum euxinus]